ncbi:MAG: CDP-alcohol phosphatidyltransferase family protein [Rubrivivax sp.]|nr:CDP-alcohol phosphatidyltransferase family protein [Rubrivivax sp.]
MAAALWVVARAFARAAPHAHFGAANRVTLLRLALGMLLAAVLAVVAAPVAEARATLPAALAWALVGVATVAALLDAVDGPLARRAHMASAFGARFDMETDAWLTLVLSALAWQLDRAGPWVLLSGLMRYAFVAAAWEWPWLAAPLAPSRRRQAVCVLQITVLVAALAPVWPRPVSSALCAFGLVLLAASFGKDLRQLARRRAASAPAAGAPGGGGRARRRRVAAALRRRRLRAQHLAHLREPARRRRCALEPAPVVRARRGGAGAAGVGGVAGAGVAPRRTCRLGAGSGGHGARRRALRRRDGARAARAAGEPGLGPAARGAAARVGLGGLAGVVGDRRGAGRGGGRGRRGTGAALGARGARRVPAAAAGAACGRRRRGAAVRELRRAPFRRGRHALVLLAAGDARAGAAGHLCSEGAFARARRVAPDAEPRLRGQRRRTARRRRAAAVRRVVRHELLRASGAGRRAGSAARAAAGGDRERWPAGGVGALALAHLRRRFVARARGAAGRRGHARPRRLRAAAGHAPPDAGEPLRAPRLPHRGLDAGHAPAVARRQLLRLRALCRRARGRLRRPGVRLLARARPGVAGASACAGTGAAPARGGRRRGAAAAALRRLSAAGHARAVPSARAVPAGLGTPAHARGLVARAACPGDVASGAGGRRGRLRARDVADVPLARRVPRRPGR